MIAAVVMAAGLASRAKGPKVLWPVDGRASAARVCEAALAAPGVDRVVVVSGAWAAELAEALKGLPVTLVHNPDYALGQAESLKTGLRALPPAARAAIFLLADQPFISSAIIANMIQCYHESGATMVAPLYKGRRRNPVLFDLAVWRGRLMELSGDQGGREILAAHPEALRLMPTDGTDEAFRDFDTLADYQAVLKMRPQVIIKGAGDLASGVAHRLSRAGYSLVMTELARPTAIRRSVAFSQAIYDGEITIEGVRARRAGLDDYREILAAGDLPVLGGVAVEELDGLAVPALVEATLAKKNRGLSRRPGRVTLALGPGFIAGVDAEAVIETARGHFLGRVILDGPAAPDTGVPGLIGGYGLERLLRAPAEGEVFFTAAIGQSVRAGETLGRVGSSPITAAIGGVLRGALQNGLTVPVNFKIGDIDPRPEAAAFIHSPSDKARAVAGGVLEALLHFGLPPRGFPV